jgi:hypothetical protein
MSRPLVYAVSLAALATVLYPILLDPQDPSQDDFPLSTYPMFSYNKPRTATVTSALALAPDGVERPVPPVLVATSETMQAFRTLSKSVRAGPHEASQLCQAIAGRIAQSGDPEFADAQQVALVTLTVDSIRYLGGDRTPLQREEHVRCPVPAAAP